MFTQDLTRSAGNPIFSLHTNLLARAKARLQRRRFNRMLDLDDHMLKDIGVTYSEVAEASALPLSQDAATALRTMSLTRKRSEFASLIR
jgi:uncharacterized protein YjiS (DUF1127 family)